MRPSVLVLFLTFTLALGGCGDGNGASSSQPAADVATDSVIGVASCNAGERIVVTIVIDTHGHRLSGVHTRLSYPATLELPGRFDEPLIAERITVLATEYSATAGVPLSDAVVVPNDDDSDGDGTDDRINILLASPLVDFADGPFVTVTFDCREGAGWPTVTDFTCSVVSAADPQLLELGPESTCHIEVGARL